MTPAARAGAGAVGAEVLIPSWNRAESLRRTLESLRAQTQPANVAVVDNGSTDCTLDMLATEFPEVRRVALGSNLGFGAALNRGVASSEAGIVIFLNNDAVADRRFVESLLRTQRATGAEMVAGCLRRIDGNIESLGVEVDRSLIAYDICYGRPYPPPAELPPPLAPTGGAAAFLRAAFQAVNGFDEEIFAYLEDVDLGIRMRLGGMRCAVASEAFAWHEHSATLGSGTKAKNLLMGRSRGYLLWKYGAGLPLSWRARGLVIDAIVDTGQVVIDRNVGSIRGRIEARRRRRGRPRPAADSHIRSLPLVPRGILQALRLRRARRR